MNFIQGGISFATIGDKAEFKEFITAGPLCHNVYPILCVTEQCEK